MPPKTWEEVLPILAIGLWLTSVLALYSFWRHWEYIAFYALAMALVVSVTVLFEAIRLATVSEVVLMLVLVVYYALAAYFTHRNVMYRLYRFS